jgi:hypothetical protein
MDVARGHIYICVFRRINRRCGEEIDPFKSSLLPIPFRSASASRALFHMNAFPKLDLTTSSASQQQYLLRQAQELVKSIKDPCSPRVGLLTPLPNAWPNASVATKHETWGGIKGVKSSITSKHEHYVSCSKADSIKVKDIISDRGTPCSIANGVSSIHGMVRIPTGNSSQDKQAAPDFISLFDQQKSKSSRGMARMVKNSSGKYTIIKTKPSCHIHLPSVHTETETSE